MTETIPSVGFGEAIKLFFSNYANFKGRSRRSEYWWAILFVNLISTLLGYVLPELGAIWMLIILIPCLSLYIRRLHDIGLSGWFYLLSWVPFLGLVWCCMDSKPDTNKWGSSTKYLSPLTGNPDHYQFADPVPQISDKTDFQPTTDSFPLIEDCPPTTPFAPALPAYGTVRICTGSMSGSSYDCASGTSVVVGRSPAKCQIVMDPQYHQVSGAHCRIDFQDGFASVTDMNSTNGTLLNGSPIPAGHPVTVRSGDQLQLANSACTLEFFFH